MFNLYRKGQASFKDEAIAMYHTAMQQARNPEFYEKMNVPDTLDGRFEMVAVHVALVLARIEGLAQHVSGVDKATLKDLSQSLFDTMFADMEESLRQIGIGDMGLPRRMKYMMQSLNGRIEVIGQAAFANDKLALAQAVRKNIYGTVKEELNEKDIDSMVEYLLNTAAKLNEQEITAFTSGKVCFS